MLRAFLSRRMNDDYSSRNRAKYGFGDYHTYDEMINWMKEIEYNYPSMTKTFSIGKTHEGREIVGIKVNSISELLKTNLFFFSSTFQLLLFPQ